MVPLAVEIDEMCKAKSVYIYIYIYHIYHLNYRILSINIYVSYFKTSRIFPVRPLHFQPWNLQRRTGCYGNRGCWVVKFRLKLRLCKRITALNESEPNFFKSFENSVVFPFQSRYLLAGREFQWISHSSSQCNFDALATRIPGRSGDVNFPEKWFLMTDLGHLFYSPRWEIPRNLINTKSFIPCCNFCTWIHFVPHW